MNITAIVLTKNEEDNIKRCIESLRWCNETIIVDDYSADKTAELARTMRARIYQHGLNNNFAAQRNFGLSKARYDWVLFIDADERVGNELKEEIKKELKKSSHINGYFFKRKDFFLGRWLKYGETNQVKLLRLGRKDKGNWQRAVHEQWIINGPTKTLQAPLEHFPHQTVSEFIDSINKFTTIEAKQRFHKKLRLTLSELIFKPLAKFMVNYFFRLGFLDGVPGLIMAVLMSYHSFLVRIKLWHLERTKNES